MNRAVDRARREMRCIALVVALAASACSRPSSARSNALPRMGQIPAFAMDDQHRSHVTDATLHGNALVVDFFFASCTTSCPLLASRMLEVQKAIAVHDKSGTLPIQLVSITLDPENDTPDVLEKYAEHVGAGPHWSFLSGRSEELDRVVVKGFKMAFEKVPSSSGIATIMHGEWMILADANGEIRGYYPAHDDERMAALAEDAMALAALAPPRKAERPAPLVEAPGDAAVGSVPEKKYRAKGTVVSFGKENAYLNIAHDDIPGYMKAMTMSFVPKQPSDVAGIKVGDRIEFEFVETEDARRQLTSIVPTH